MRILLCGFFVSTLLLVGCSQADPCEKAWLDTFSIYVHQKYPDKKAPSTAIQSMPLIQFREVLAKLPPPKSWPILRASLQATKDKLPPSEVNLRASYQLGIVLLSYLQSQPEKTLSALSALDAETKPDASKEPQKELDIINSEVVSLREEMERSEGSKNAQGLKRFEDELKALDPVSDADLEKAVGGPAALAQFKAFVHELVDFQRRALASIIDFRDGTRSTLAQEKEYSRLISEFQKTHRDDFVLLEKIQNDPTVTRYFRSITESAMEGRYVQELSVPDLVGLVGNEKAAALLRRALSYSVMLEIEPGNKTAKLAQNLVLQNIDSLKIAQWQLINSPDDAPLFEALRKHFGEPLSDPESNSRYEEAKLYYILYLIAQNRSSEAVTLLSSFKGHNWNGFSSEDAERLVEEGRGEALWAFLREALVRVPQFPEWDLFTELSLQYGKQKELLELIESQAKNQKLNPKERADVRRRLVATYLAVNRIDEALALLNPMQSGASSSVDQAKDKINVALQIMTLSPLLHRDILYQNALHNVEAQLEVLRQRNFSEYLSAQSDLLGNFFSMEKYDEIVVRAPRVLEEVRKQQARNEAAKKKNETFREGDQLSEWEVSGLLKMDLAALVKMGRYDEALKLLTENPYWNASDLARLLDSGTVSSSNRPLGYFVAKALIATDQKELARRVLEAQLGISSGDDGVYELYIDLLGDEAVPWLNKLFAIDPFQERPLLWKATLAFRNGQLDLAEKWVHEALTIDPTDGEEGPGDRLRGYSILEQIALAKKEVTQAKTYHDIVTAVRLSEEGDRYKGAGLNTQAIDRYRTSLGIFSEGYCIQFRLAARLAEQGRMEEALQHYRKAYELMPGSFGRVESYCFGCEKVFAGKKQQNIAEKVFSEIAKANPTKPQVHYMMGFLKMEQNKHNEALIHFKEAVKLDPQYLNAWKQIGNLNGKVPLETSYRDQVLLTLLRLDPAGHHGSGSLDDVSNIPSLWLTLQAIAPRLASTFPPEKLMDLPASRRYRSLHSNYSGYSSWSDRRPESVLLGRALIRTIGVIFSRLQGNTNPYGNLGVMEDF